MPKITEKHVVRTLKERTEKLGNKIKETEAALIALDASEESAKLSKKNRKVIKAAETELKKSFKKKDKISKVKKGTSHQIGLTTSLKHILPPEEEK